MTLFLDSSALLRRYVHGPGQAMVAEAMADDPSWAASALCRSETLLALHRLAATPRQHERLWSRLRDDWDAFLVVPLDERCLARAVELGAGYGLRTVDALHLAAADRLPRPARYATFDRRQIPAAAALGFDVLSPVERPLEAARAPAGSRVGGRPPLPPTRRRPGGAPRGG